MKRKRKMMAIQQVELRGRVPITMKDRVDELYAAIPRFRSWNQCFHEVVLAGLGVMESFETKQAAEKIAKRADAKARCDDGALASTVEPVAAPKEKAKVNDMMPAPEPTEAEIEKEAMENPDAFDIQ